MIERQLRLTGIVTGSVFLAGMVLDIIIGIGREDSLQSLLTNLSIIGCAVVATLFFVSARWPKLFWIQPVVYLLLTPIPLLQMPVAFYGLGFFVCAMAILFRMGFFEKYRIVRLACCLAYLLSIEVAAIFTAKNTMMDAISAIFFILAFLMFFYLMFQDKLMVFLSEPKQKLSLYAKGLSDTESDYIIAIISGKSVKETAFDAGVSESTVRNMLARSYTKLGVTNRSELFALAEKHDIVR